MQNYNYGITSSLENIGDLFEKFNNLLKVVILDGDFGTGKSTLCDVFKDHIAQINKKLEEGHGTITLNGKEYNQIYIHDIPDHKVDTIRESISKYINNPAYEDVAIFFFKEEAADMKIDALQFYKDYTDSTKYTNLFFLFTSNGIRQSYGKTTQGNAILDRSIIIDFHRPKIDFVSKFVEDAPIPDGIINPKTKLAESAEVIKEAFLKLILGKYLSKVSYRVLEHNVSLMKQGMYFNIYSFLELPEFPELNTIINTIALNRGMPQNLNGISWMMKEVNNLEELFFAWNIFVSKHKASNDEELTAIIKRYASIMKDTRDLNREVYNVKAQVLNLATILYLRK